MNQAGLQRTLRDQSSGSGHTIGTPRHPKIKDPILSKRVCFYKSGDPQFNGLRMVINSRTFKTFDALLDSLSKKVPLPFGVRNITTPRGVHAVYTLDELEDGKSYICSDSRKVKPINLALARRKLPPWYHARPASSRRRTVQRAMFFPGRNIHKQEPVVMRTPKKLLVFRNGDHTVRRTVVLHKRTTPTFESILQYISELMQFHVVKLHTPDGRRVDGLPGLILCSGTVVAAGREPFKSANYNAQKSPTQTRSPTNQTSLRRLKSLNRKKKSLPYSSKSRNFSLSSERYIVNQIHNSIVESSCDLPSNPTNSVELESNHILESVGDTEVDGAGGPCLLPTEDDIEKSFRVNQDGSMTVEMRVRLTIKEEETIHWTTTLQRSSVANQLNASCLQQPEVEQEICLPKSNSLDLQSPTASIDTMNKDKTDDNSDEDPPPLSNGAFSEGSIEEDNFKVQADMVSPRRVPTPGHRLIRKKQASMESIRSLLAEGVQEGMVESYSYKDQIENGPMTEQYCMVKQSTSRPVPKPRRLGSVDANNINSKNVSTFKSAEMTEILQIESSGEEVTETVVHIYEQQTCQDNFLANICAQSISNSGIPFGRPATSETGQHSSNNEFEPGIWRPSTASESISICRAENMSVISNITLPSLKMAAIQTTDREQRFPKFTGGKNKPQQREVSKGKRVSLKPKVINKRIRRVLTPAKKPKANSAEAMETRKTVKTFSSAGFIESIYGNKSKSAKNTKLRKRPAQKDWGVKTKIVQPSDDAINCISKDPNIPSPLKENTSKTVSVEKIRLNELKGILKRQTSVHQVERNENNSCNISKSMTLPAFNSSSSVTNEYVENWLEKAQHSPTSSPDEESTTSEALTLAQKGNERFGEPVYNDMLNLKSDTVPASCLGTSVKLKIQCFENKSSPSVEKSTVTQQGEITHSQATANMENCTSGAQNTTGTIKHLLNHICSEINPVTKKTSTGNPSDNTGENKSSSVKISLQKATPFNTISTELPPPSPPAKLTKLSNTEYCIMEVSSAASSPLYRFSSVSSQMSDNYPLSISPASDKAISPTDKMQTTTARTDIYSVQTEALLTRTPTIKRAPLVSNRSLERKMSLRKACLDTYTLCTDASTETTTSCTPINTVGDDDNVLPNDFCLTGTQLPPETTQQSSSIVALKSSPSCCNSASPTSLTSVERMSSASLSSSEAPTPSENSLIEMKTINTQFLSHKESSSPKPLLKKVNLTPSPPPERKPQAKKFSCEFADDSPKLLHSYHSDKTSSSSNNGIPEHATPTAAPSTERKKMLYKPKLQKRSSPYSQSLDMVSPPVRHKSSRKMLSGNLSSDSASEPANKTKRKTSSSRKHHQTSPKMEARQANEKKSQKTDDFRNTDQGKSVTDTQLMTQPLKITNQPNIKPVLEKICYSIKSIRHFTQNKRPSCLEKSNSLPDFSSHVASTFGSSTKVLLAFLSVMTLKEGMSHFSMDELNAGNVSCSEALKMIDSLREIASIEDSNELKASLSNLQQSASKQLLQSWKGFQELSDKCQSLSPTPNYSQQELLSESSQEKDCGMEENVIDQIMDNLDMPEKLKEELASLSMGVKTESDDEEKLSARLIEKLNANGDPKMSQSSTEDAINVRNVAKEEKDNVDVSSIIKKFTNVNHPKQSDMGSVPLITQRMKHKSADQTTKDRGSQYCQNNVAKCPTAEPGDNQITEERQLYSTVLCKQHSSEEEQRDAECEEIQQELSESEDLSNPDSHSEAEEDKQPSCNYYVELKVSRKQSISSPDSETQPLSEEEQPEVKCRELSSVLKSEEPDVEEQTSSGERQPEVDCQAPNVILEESLSGTEEERESIEQEEEEPLDDLPGHEEDMEKCKKLKTLIEETEEAKITSDPHTDKKLFCDTKRLKTVHGDLSNMIENLDSQTQKGKSSLIKSDSLAKRYKFNADEDSGNDHSSCEEQVEVEQPKIAGEQISCSTEEELCYYEKESSSEEEEANVDRYIGESCKEYQEVPASATESEVTKCERVVVTVKHQSEEIVSRSVAERVSLLEKQVAVGQKMKNITECPAIRRVSQRNVHMESDVEDSPSESPMSQSTLCTRSAPQSSLSFSYDSSGVITTEPEGSRVRSIREMFLAKSATDVQQRHGRFPSPNTSEMSKFRAETSTSGGYQSQTSSELSSGEDDSARKTITKGFVRRTIERLYGKKDPDEEASERPPSAPKEKKKDHSSIFSPFHIARSKAMSELSYFNSSNAMDTLSEATKCIAFNAQVGPGDCVPFDDGRWLLRENTLIRKSVSDPVGINKAFTNSSLGEDTEQNTTHLLFSTNSELEDKTKSLSRKCTYFSLPHASDSDVCQDDLSTVSRSSVNGDSIVDTKDNSEDTGMWSERNGKLPAAGITDFKMMDNKVHPLMEVPPDGEVVVVQPRKGQAVINRRLQEPDMLDVLYNFCGQHCPIL